MQRPDAGQKTRKAEKTVDYKRPSKHELYRQQCNLITTAKVRIISLAKTPIKHLRKMSSRIKSDTSYTNFSTHTHTQACSHTHTHTRLNFIFRICMGTAAVQEVPCLKQSLCLWYIENIRPSYSVMKVLLIKVVGR